MSTQHPNQIPCPECGEAVPQGRSACESCGMRLPGAPPPFASTSVDPKPNPPLTPTPVTAPAAKERKGTHPAIVAVLCLVVLGVAVTSGVGIVGSLASDATANDDLAESAPQQTVAVLFGVRDALQALVLAGYITVGLLAVVAILLGFVLGRQRR